MIDDIAVRRTTGLLAAAVLSGLVLVGCGDDGGPSDNALEQIIEENTDESVDIDIDEDDGSMSIETDDGSFSAGSDMPEDFPDDVYIPDGFELQSSARQEADGDMAFALNGLVDRDPEDVSAEVEGAYDQEPISTFSTGETYALVFEDVGGSNVSYTMTTDEAGTFVSIVVAPTEG